MRLQLVLRESGAGDPLLCGGGLAFLMTLPFGLRSRRRESSLPYLNFRFVCGPLEQLVGSIR